MSVIPFCEKELSFIAYAICHYCNQDFYKKIDILTTYNLLKRENDYSYNKRYNKDDELIIGTLTEQTFKDAKFLFHSQKRNKDFEKSVLNMLSSYIYNSDYNDNWQNKDIKKYIDHTIMTMFRNRKAENLFFYKSDFDIEQKRLKDLEEKKAENYRKFMALKSSEKSIKTEMYRDNDFAYIYIDSSKTLHLAYDDVYRKFRIGDEVKTGSYNLIYTGKITNITIKSVFTLDDGYTKQKRFKMMDFIKSNYNLDLIKIGEHNANEHYYI